MPEYLIERGNLSEEVEHLEQRGEVIVSVVNDGNDFRVFTRHGTTIHYRVEPGEQETR